MLTVVYFVMTRANQCADLEPGRRRQCLPYKTSVLQLAAPYCPGSGALGSNAL